MLKPLQTLVRLQEFVNTTKASTFEIIQTISESVQIHQRIVKSNLQLVTLEELKQITQYEDNGQNDDVEDVKTGHSDQMSVEAAKELVNHSLEMLECSPLKTLRSERTLKLGKRKIESTISKLRSTIAIEPQLASSKNECDNCARLVTSIKEKLVLSNRERKIQLLTFVPHDWSVI